MNGAANDSMALLQVGLAQGTTYPLARLSISGVLKFSSYFNTVGSKEGWAPSTFISSKTNRTSDAASRQRAEDFMDKEDLADAEEGKRVTTKSAYSGFGSTEDELSRRESPMDLWRSTGESMGVKLLRKMGWKDGQGIGPKIFRRAWIDDEDIAGLGAEPVSHSFAPNNTQITAFVRKNDHKGLGYQGGDRLNETSTSATTRNEDELSDNDMFTVSRQKIKRKPPTARGGFGTGVLNDTGSDDEDPYNIGPQISYNRVIGVDKKKKKKTEVAKATSTISNPSLRNKPVFMSKRFTASSESTRFKKCHDGRLPLEGFILSSNGSSTFEDKQYSPPTVPDDWKPHKAVISVNGEPGLYESSAELAKRSMHDPTSRASLLGETLLPGKSVFDYLTPAARDKIASITNNQSLPAGLAQSVPQASIPSPENFIPPLDPQIAATALGRGKTGFVPYADDPGKLARYRAFLSYRANLTTEVPTPSNITQTDGFVKELHEFAHAATIFKPMTGLMASRFTSSSTGPQTSTVKDPTTDSTPLLSQPTKITNPAEEAARMSMFGPLTRSSAPFFPSRLLCKRFNVPAPANVAPDNADNASRTMPTAPFTTAPAMNSRFESSGYQMSESQHRKKLDILGEEDMAALRQMGGIKEEDVRREGTRTKVDVERNEALEAERPGEEVFRAIFGSDSEDE